MASKDICRVCLQKVNSEEVEELDLKKLEQVIQTALLPNLDLGSYRNHFICLTCIDNFRTLTKLHKLCRESNMTVGKEKYKISRSLDNKIDLKQLDKFKTIESVMQSNVFVCRLCLETTNWVAVHLYDKPENILPKQHVHTMLIFSRITLYFLSATLKPCLCYTCWQRILVAFSFRKHLESVLEKVNFYQNLLNTRCLDKEDLEDVFCMWDNLGLLDADANPKLYGLFHERNHSKKDRESNISNSRSLDDMPLLERCSIEDLKEKNFNMPKKVSRRINPLKLKGGKTKKALKQPKKPKREFRSDQFNTSIEIEKNRRRSARLIAKREPVDESSSGLLILKKEEIVRKRRYKKKSKPVAQMKQTYNNEYTFENMKIENNESQNYFIPMEEQIQVKNEPISEAEEFDDGAAYPSNGMSEEPCPNLDVFIKTEPIEILDMNESNEEPPELELQGLCNYDPKFTISNTFSLNDQHALITVDEKRDFLNLWGVNSQLKSSAMDVASKVPIKRSKSTDLLSKNGAEIPMQQEEYIYEYYQLENCL